MPKMQVVKRPALHHEIVWSAFCDMEWPEGMLAELRLSGGINALARQLGRPPALAFAATEALLPQLLLGFRSYPGGSDALLAMIGALGGARLAEAVMGTDRADPAPGEAILAKLSPFSHEDDLPALLAMLAGGYLFARAATGTLSPQELSRLLGEASVPPPPPDEAV